MWTSDSAIGFDLRDSMEKRSRVASAFVTVNNCKVNLVTSEQA
jgi:hypothetical protein